MSISQGLRWRHGPSTFATGWQTNHLSIAASWARLCVVSATLSIVNLYHCRLWNEKDEDMLERGRGYSSSRRESARILCRARFLQVKESPWADYRVYRYLQEMGIFVTHEFRVERSRWARGCRCGMGDAIECTIIENFLYSACKVDMHVRERLM